MKQKPVLSRKQSPNHDHMDSKERALIESISLSSFVDLSPISKPFNENLLSQLKLEDEFSEDDEAVLRALQDHMNLSPVENGEVTDEANRVISGSAGSVKVALPKLELSASLADQAARPLDVSLPIMGLALRPVDLELSPLQVPLRDNPSVLPAESVNLTTVNPSVSCPSPARGQFFTTPIDQGTIEDINIEDIRQNQLKRQLPSPMKQTNPQKLNRLNQYSASQHKFTMPVPQVIQHRQLNTSSAGKAHYPTIQLATQTPQAVENPSDAPKTVKAMLLSNEQEYILQQAMEGISLFYTGSAGTGKSILLKSIIKSLRRKFRPGNVAVTASTGLAACNIGGITLHSFSGVGLGAEPVDKLLKKVRVNKKALERWINTKVLIIDEISMVDGEFLNKLNEIAKRIRRNDRPFGGIQLIVCGDFYQLPPVVKNDPNRDPSLPPKEPFFSFECSAWQENIQLTLILREVFRQKGDQTFIDMLNEMRTGVVSDETLHEFRRLDREVECPAGLTPSELFATRNEVETSNNGRLRKLSGLEQRYDAVDGGSLQPQQRQILCNNFLAPTQLLLKVGAQVMCIKNFDDTLVNGSMGKVVDFMYKETYMKAREAVKLEEPDTSIEEKPDVTVNPDYIFNDLELLSAKDPASDARAVNRKRKKQLGTDLENAITKRMYPVVKFMNTDGSSRTVLFEPEQWTIEDDKDNSILVSRTQFPLILAWALSIHKSQGQTLQHVKVDLRNIFEKGQAYVALSRATSRDGLRVVNFSKDKVSSHRKVIAFYKTLITANEHGVQRVRAGQQLLPFLPANAEEY